jgi:hypothetical protein
MVPARPDRRRSGEFLEKAPDYIDNLHNCPYAHTNLKKSENITEIVCRVQKKSFQGTVVFLLASDSKRSPSIFPVS